MKLGMFDPPEMVPYSKIDEKLLDGPEHRALARKLANESMVLLKNDGTLPLKTSGVKIAVVGPLADQTAALLGNYNGIPTHTVSALEGLRAEFPDAQIRFVPGTQFLRKEASPVPTELLSISGHPGVYAHYYYLTNIFDLLGTDAPLALLAKREEPGIGLALNLPPQEIAGKSNVVVVWEMTFAPHVAGEYNFGVRGEGFFRVSLNGTPAAMAFDTNGVETKLGRVHFEEGKTYALKLEYGLNKPAAGAPQIVWSKRETHPAPEAIAAAQDADVVVAVVGLTSELESEEMLVSEEGFKGGDRTSLDLPKPEQDLLEGVASTGKPLVVVLMNGSALSVNWVKEHANAILEAWYSGEEGGAAIAQTLAGVNNPSGRLPVTFYTGVDQLPPFEDYSMAKRTYRYFTGTPLYPFGYGLSYSKFAYSNVQLSAKNVKAGDALGVDADVTNTSQRDGEEVVELYLTFPKLPGAPVRSLRGFTRVHILAGKTQHVHLTISPRDLSYVNEAGDRLIAPGSYTLSLGGGQPGSGVPVVESAFTITGQMQLRVVRAACGCPVVLA